MFVPVKRLVGDVEPFERLPGASGLSLGMAAVYSGAAGLAKCGAAAKPQGRGRPLPGHSRTAHHHF